MTKQEKIAEVIKVQYNDFRGRVMWGVKEIHNRIRLNSTDEQYLEFLEKCVKENPRPVYKPLSL